MVCAVAAWGGLTPEPRPIITPDAPGTPSSHRWFTALVISYFLEGIGYIIAGTFLVAAIDLAALQWVGSGAWIVVGLAAFPSCALWAWLSLRWSRPTLLLVALLIQAVGIALPAVIGGVGPRTDFSFPVRCHLPRYRVNCVGNRRAPAVPTRRGVADRWIQRRSDSRPTRCHSVAARRVSRRSAVGCGRRSGRGSGRRGFAVPIPFRSRCGPSDSHLD